MQNAMPFIIVAVLIVVVIGAIFNAIAQGKRREGLIELARRLNLNFDAGTHYSIPDQFSFLKQLDQGDNRYATNVLSGNYRQNEVLVFDYHYETHSTDSKGHTQTEDHWFSFFILFFVVNI